MNGLSIQIPSLGEESMFDVIRSARQTTTLDVEIVVALSESGSDIAGRIAREGAQVVLVPRHCGLLRASGAAGKVA